MPCWAWITPNSLNIPPRAPELVLLRLKLFLAPLVWRLLKSTLCIPPLSAKIPLQDGPVIFACLHRPYPTEGMPVIWSRRPNEIYGLIVEYPAHILNPLWAATGTFLYRIATVLTNLFIHIDNVSDFAILAAGECAYVTTAPTPATDHPTKQLFIFASALRLCNAADHRGCGYCRRSRCKH